jgi:hypothetical protein
MFVDFELSPSWVAIWFYVGIQSDVLGLMDLDLHKFSVFIRIESKIFLSGNFSFLVFSTCRLDLRLSLQLIVPNSIVPIV